MAENTRPQAQPVTNTAEELAGSKIADPQASPGGGGHFWRRPPWDSYWLIDIRKMVQYIFMSSLFIPRKRVDAR